MPTETVPAPARAILRIEIPSDLYESYVLQAGSQPVESYIGDRLQACLRHTASRPLYFNDQERGRLEHALGKNCYKPEDAVQAIAKAISVKINGVNVLLSPNLIERLKTRAEVSHVPLTEYIAKEVTRSLEEHVGLR